jgi:hypothetical protein
VAEIEDLVNSKVHRVRAPELGAPSHEWKNREERGLPLDIGHGRTIGLEPHRLSRVRGSKVQRSHFRLQKW